jgi:hypothetical protein
MPLAQFAHSALILSYMPTRISLLVQNNMIIEFEILVRLANACCYCCCFAHMNVGLKRDIVRAQAENETLAAIRDRLDNEGKYAEEQLLKIKVKSDRKAKILYCTLPHSYQICTQSDV